MITKEPRLYGRRAADVTTVEPPTPAEAAALTRTRPSSRFDPAWLLVLFTVAIPLSPEFHMLGVNKVRLTDVLLLPTIMAFLGATATSRRRSTRVTLHPIVVPMLVVLAWDFLCLTLFNTADLRDGQSSTGMNYLLKRAEYFVIFYLGMLVASTPGRLELILSRFYLAAPVMNMIVLVEYWRHSGDSEAYRASGMVADQPNSTAMFIVLSLAVAFCMVPIFRRKIERVSLILSIVTGLGALFVTGSREGVVCLMVVVAAVAVKHRLLNFQYGAIFVLACLGFWQFAPEAVQARLQSIPQEIDITTEGISGDRDVAVDAGHSSMAARIWAAQHAFGEVIPQSPLTGFGMAYYSLGVLDNTYLAEIIYNGLIGLGLFAWLVFRIAKMIRRGQTVPGADNLTRAFSTALGMGLLALLIGGLAMESFYVIRPMEAFFLFSGLLGGQIAALDSSSTAQKRAGGRAVGAFSSRGFTAVQQKPDAEPEE